jgi:hypothetical protein
VNPIGGALGIFSGTDHALGIAAEVATGETTTIGEGLIVATPNLATVATVDPEVVAAISSLATEGIAARGSERKQDQRGPRLQASRHP